MNNSDNLDIDSMVNNPFRFLTDEKPGLHETPERDNAAPAAIPATGESQHVQGSSSGKAPDEQLQSSMSKNHPLELRVLNLEKNLLIDDRKIETTKQIIEHQNKRIELLEKELDLLRNQNIE